MKNIPVFFLVFLGLAFILTSFQCTPKASTKKSDQIESPKEVEFSNLCLDPKKLDLDKKCPRLHQPVCGCNKKTYPNSCEAEKAGVVKWTNGQCIPGDCIDQSKINKNQPCNKMYAPVCGCDGVTYDNECYAQKNGLTIWKKGKCLSACIDPTKIDKTKRCETTYKPVCGCDGVTYSNKCIAEKNGLQKWMPGKCDSINPTGCIDKNKIDPEGICPMDYSPICGCDGHTYSNKCHATKAGVTKWKPGECK